MRDLIAIGVSAGGVEALPRLASRLDASLPASVLVVQHLAPQNDPYLVEILQRASTLPVAWAEQGERLRHGHLYIAPPDLHLLVVDGHVRLSGDARENFARPSIDRLFRSVAATHGARTIGVLLTGMMRDGVAGLRAIQRVGGATLVQDPDDAAFPELPRNALRVMTPDRVVGLEGIAPELRRLVRAPARDARIPEPIALEAELDRLGDDAAPEMLDRLGTRSTLVCPECSGPLWDVGDDQLRRYRCYLGHVVTASDLLDRSGDDVERALWTAIRTLHDQAATWSTLANDARRAGGASARSFEERAEAARAHAEVLRRFVIDLGRS